MEKQTFALYFGNRGFFPGSLIKGAREEMCKAVENAGFSYIIPDESLTRFGAVETIDEGRAYAAWLKSHEGEYSGVIICLPNFGDENGAVTALRDCGTPILIQAYPDEIGKMDPASRRDSFCGKLSICDVFHQYNLPFTVMAPHVVHPLSDKFRENLLDFAAVCRVVKGMKNVTVGVIGARVTAFKTVRFDELTLQKYGITTESFDFSMIIDAISKMEDDSERVLQKAEFFKDYANCADVPNEKLLKFAKLYLAIEDIFNAYHLNAVAVRCWNEMQDILGISPCVVLSALNDSGIVAACECDVCSALSMYAMKLASGIPAVCLDWNNNYGLEEDKCILFHCGQVPRALMADKGRVTDHPMHAKRCKGCGWGSNEGRIASFPMTYSNCKTENGVLSFYADEGEFTEDEIESEFFGCAAVAKIDGLQDKLLYMAKNGFRHHTAVGYGHMKKILTEAFGTYLKYDISKLQ